MGFFHGVVTHAAEELVEGESVFRGHLHAHEHTAEIGAVVAVVEQTDVPVGL
jgi:3-deoxy-D-arabino-heptulosonate 7-phosphate (DAHP) synthase